MKLTSDFILHVFKRFHIFLSLLLVLASCADIKRSAKYGFSEGWYQSRLYGKKDKKIYVVPSDDSIQVYSAKSLLKGSADTTQAPKIVFLPDQKPLALENYVFRKSTLDVDVLSIIMKYRPAVRGFPKQLNTTLNGALYMGYRSDIYMLSYKRSPLKIYKRSITHYGYSFGLFSGIGTARIDEYVTNNAVTIQYDGVVSASGFALIVGVENLSFGLTLGIDYLLDPNRKYWVNQTKPWAGISFGLNLN